LFIMCLLKNTINEARSIRQNLESIMENAADISRSIVDDIDKRVSSKKEICEETVQYPVSETLCTEPCLAIMEIKETVEPDDEGEKGYRLKVHELARELGMSSKRLINILKDMGYNISHHMNSLDTHIVKEVKGKINKADLLEIKADDQEKHKSLVKHNERADIAKINAYDSSAGMPGIASPQKPEIQAKKHKEMDIGIDDLKSAHPYLAVRTLFEKGYSVREIAKLLERGQGEVSLILNLTKKKQAR